MSLLSFPIDAWLLLLVAVGLGLGLEVAFYRAQRTRASGLRARGPERTGTRRPGAPDRTGDA